MLKIGVNTPLLKESIAEIGIYDTLKWVAEIGYHYIEVSQCPDQSGDGKGIPPRGG